MLPRIYFAAGFCFVITFGLKYTSPSPRETEYPKIEQIPMKRDLFNYLRALNRLLEFSGVHKNYIDINLYFGLFLAKVNLKRALEEKQEVLPEKLRMYVEEVIRKAEELLQYFKYTFEQDYEPRNNKYKKISSLFVNETNWIKRLRRFHETYFNLEKVEAKWISYKQYIDDRNFCMPNPRQSDLCLTSLASARVIKIGNSQQCKVLKSCYDMLNNGTDFGYALAHRLLFLQQAAYARDCFIFSELKDEEMRHRFCTMAYQEAEYIAIHNYEIVDLLLEHICLCALEGHTTFLKRSWLSNILRFQTADGCFSPTLDRSRGWYQPIVFRGKGIDNHTKIDGNCNGHTSALAAATLAIACRFIIQFNF